MKIGLITPYNPLDKNKIGGLEIGTLRLALSFKKLGNEAIIITKGSGGEKNGILIYGKKNIVEISKWLIEDKSLDVIQWMEIFPWSGDIKVQSLVSGLLRCFGKKVFLMVATSKNLEKRGRGNLVSTLIRNVFNGYIVSNLDQIREFREYGIVENVFPIGLGIDTKNAFYPADKKTKMKLRKKLSLPINKTLILFMGRFVERKRANFLLKVWQELTHIYNKAYLIMIGPGMGYPASVEKEVLEMAKESSNLILKQFSYDLNPSDYFRACDMLVLPSSREGQPNVLLEAMACGLPVIGSDIPGINELLKDKTNGLLFSLGNLNQLRNAILELVNDKELRIRLGREGMELVRKVKDIDFVAKQYVKIYKK
jgi:glycosyltransferase involved in cell wall biosynthesis